MRKNKFQSFKRFQLNHFALLLLLIPLAGLHAAESKVFDIRSYGAVGDSQTINTIAIQKAIDACHAAGGGTVLVPEGVFVSGSLRLKSQVTLKIAKDAILRGSTNITDYAVETAELQWGGFWKSSSSQWRQCLIYAEGAEEISIEGPGTIDGQGNSERKVFPNKQDLQRRTPMLIRFEHCRNVMLRGLTLIDPAKFTTFFSRSEEIQIEGITVRSRKSHPGNALVFAGSRRIRILNCNLNAGDDAITFQTFHPDWPNEDIAISGCHITSTWCAIRIGPESLGATRRLSMRNCTFTNCQGGIKIESTEGQTHEDLSFSNIQMAKVCQPIMVLASRFAFSINNTSVRPPVGHIRNVRFEHIRAIAAAGKDVAMEGKRGDVFRRLCSAVVSLPGTRIEDISFKNIDLTFSGGGTAEQASRLDVGELLETFDYMKWAVPFDGELPASALYLRHVKGVRLENVRFTVEKPDARAFIAGDDIEGLTLNVIVARAPVPVPGLAKLADARNVIEKYCRVECGTSVPVLVTPTSEELCRLADLRTRSAALDHEIQEKADEADAAAKIGNISTTKKDDK